MNLISQKRELLETPEPSIMPTVMYYRENRELAMVTIANVDPAVTIWAASMLVGSVFADMVIVATDAYAGLSEEVPVRGGFSSRWESGDREGLTECFILMQVTKDSCRVFRQDYAVTEGSPEVVVDGPPKALDCASNQGRLIEAASALFGAEPPPVPQADPWQQTEIGRASWMVGSTLAFLRCAPEPIRVHVALNEDTVDREMTELAMQTLHDDEIDTVSSAIWEHMIGEWE